MPFQGQEFTQGMRQFVVNLKKYFDDQRLKNGQSAQWVVAQTANALGIGEASVRRIMADYNKNERRIPVDIQKSRGRPEHAIPFDVLPNIRKYIRSQNLLGKHISLDLIGEVLKEQCNTDFSTSTIWRTLHRWGFTHGSGHRRSALKERDYVILARRKYLRIRRANRKNDGSLIRPEVYLDETFINKNHSNQFTWYWHEDGPQVNKPSGKGERLVIINAITSDGWVDGAQLVFESQRRSGDYHGQMDWDKFSSWFKERLLPNIPPNSIIIMDNAAYHNTLTENSFPTSRSKKEQIRDWLNIQDIPYEEEMLKAELYALCQLKPKLIEYKIDILAQKAGHSILRTPQYHPELQPIETCWAIVKNYMARNCDFTLSNFRAILPEAFAQVTKKSCQKLIEKAVNEEDKFWVEDRKLEECQELDEFETEDIDNND